MPCIHTWCARADHSDNPDMHEGAPALVATVDQPRFPSPPVKAQLSYRDGDRAALLYLSAHDVELTTHAVADLIEELRHRLDQMRAVHTTAVAVTR